MNTSNSATRSGQVTVIIPTMAEEMRFPQCQRTIVSIKDSSKNPVEILAVVNGHRKSDRVIEMLKSHEDVSLLYLEEASLPGVCTAAFPLKSDTKSRRGSVVICTANPINSAATGKCARR